MPKKVFELAKELNMGAVDLVEDLKKKGFAVKNHMQSLSDEELDKVMASFAPSEDEAAAKKKTKKKAVRKKATKKKATTAASGDAKKAKKKKASVTRKKTVIRKKGGEDEAEIEIDTGSTPVGTEPIEAPARKESPSLEEAFDVAGTNTAENDSGLRVVSRPETSVEVPANATEEEKVEIYREKTHKFTPVFIPERSAQTTDSNKPASDASSTAGGAPKEGAAEGEGKKRLGGLATMMSGKKTLINRSQAITLDRAESELKSYSSLSGTGRPIYTTVKRKRTYSGPTKSTRITELKDSKKVVKINDGATAQDLARKLKVKLKDMIDQCLDLALLIKGEDFIGLTLCEEISALYGYRVENTAFDEDKAIGKVEISDEAKEKLPLRDPIITIMGHVDHGKTTLLDYIRNEKVADGEAGGITQHIGAYSVTTQKGKKLTFLDTPGHAAFASMRQRGANVTDIVILVVAADDGVMPQTKESVKFIQNAGVPLIVAINKMDKEGANPDRVKNELTEFHITPEEWGGDTMMVPISALKGDGVDNLLESVALQAEVMELRAEPKGRAEGVVIESKVEPGRGPVATVLIQSGTLSKGDTVVVGECYGRARNLMASDGKNIPKAGPSIPIQILGLNEAPSPGDKLDVVKNEREGKKVVQNRIDDRKKLEAVPQKSTVSLEDFFGQEAPTGAEKRILNMIVRSDVQGSFEAIKQALLALSNAEVEVKILGGGVGAISDSDVQLASAASGIIAGFNMRPVTTARKLSEQLGVEIRTYSIIYEIINDVTLALEGMLEPERIEKYIGRAEVKETFSVPKFGVIAGSVVIDGNIQVGCNVRLLREGKIVYDGSMSSLRRFKDDVKEVKNGFECGVSLEGYNDVKIGDLYECYLMEEKKRTLDDVKEVEPVVPQASNEEPLEETQL